MITEEALTEFKALYLKKYGVSLNNHEAERLGSGLINMIKAVFGCNLPRLTFDRGVRKDNNRIELRKRLGFLMPSLDRT